MQSISSLASGVSKAVWGESTPQQQSGEEPISGETGKGTADAPYDAGNEPEQAEANETTGSAPTVTTTEPAESTAEPATKPAAEPAAEPTTDSSPDRPLNARMPSFATKVTSNTPAVDAGPIDESQMAAAGKPLDEPASDSVVKDNTTTSAVKKPDPNNPFDAAKNTSTPPSEASRLRVDSADRSVSPGARPDGSHAETGKVEKTKLSTKLKGKFHLGSSSSSKQ